jgi:hypothetical protein
LMVTLAEKIREEGIELESVSLGSTPTAEFAARVEGVTEIRPGALRIAFALQPRAVVAPPLPYGVSYHHISFPGTMTVSPEPDLHPRLFGTLARTPYAGVARRHLSFAPPPIAKRKKGSKGELDGLM